MIPLCIPEIRGNEWKYLKACLDTGWVSSAGPFVDRFEREMAAYVGSPHSIATVTGTAGLHVALKMIGLQPDEEVIVPDLTFVASVNAVRYCQAHPVFMDVDSQTWQMDPEKLERFLTTECEPRESQCFNKLSGRRVRAVLPVHVFGNACEIDRIVDLAKQYGLRVVEDAAGSIGVRYKGRHVGTFGDAGVISFNGNKTITAGGGGMIFTSDPERAKYARYLTTQAKNEGLEFFHMEVGFNYRLSNLHAAIGVAQLELVEEFLEKKRSIAKRYNEAFRDFADITVMPATPHTEAAYWQYMLLLAAGTTIEKRKAVLKGLFDNGVAARPFWHPIHSLPPYKAYQAYQIEHSVRLYERGIGLPCSVGLSSNDLEKAIATFKKVVTAVLSQSCVG
ncbi:MAG: LegC family aminotransferase [Acidobacteria bacterium]|nr:MAG: LegC family aminotransferase [Acidobacteriota bacterium]